MARQRLDWSAGAGSISYIFVVIGMALGLAQLELVLSESREPVRYQLKFILIGLGALASYHIYQASQMLLFPLWQAGYVLVAALVTAMALALVSFGLARTRLHEVVVNAYISQQALLGSITFIVIGLVLAGGRSSRRVASPDGSTAVDRSQYCPSVWISDRPRHPDIFQKGRFGNSPLSRTQFLPLQI